MTVDQKMLETYFHLMNTNGIARVYHTALEAGILGAIARGPASVEQVCEKCGTQPRPTRLVLEALVAVGVAEPADEKYRAALVTQMLLMSDYRNLGDKYWSHLDPFLQDGVPLARMDDPAESEKHYQAQAAILGWMLTPAAQAASRLLLNDGSRKGISILDVGAGSGVWSLSLAAADPTINVTALDWPGVLQVTEETAEGMDLAERLTCIAGNYHEVEFETAAYDLVIVANVTHLETVENNRSLFSRLYAAVKPGGELLVVDAFDEGENRDPTAFALYAIGLALRTVSGAVHSRETLESLITSAGFDPPEYVPLDTPPGMLGMLLARK